MFKWTTNNKRDKTWRKEWNEVFFITHIKIRIFQESNKFLKQRKEGRGLRLRFLKLWNFKTNRYTLLLNWTRRSVCSKQETSTRTKKKGRKKANEGGKNAGGNIVEASMARVQVAADALHLKPTRLRVLSSYKRTSGPVLDYLFQPFSLSTLSISHLPLPRAPLSRR